MQNLFVTYEIAKKLKEKGFDGLCFTYFFAGTNDLYDGTVRMYNFNKGLETSAPLWQQVIDWLREEHNVIVSIQPREKLFIGVREYFINDSWRFNSTDKLSYNEARQKVIEEALKLIKK